MTQIVAHGESSGERYTRLSKSVTWAMKHGTGADRDRYWDLLETAGEAHGVVRLYLHCEDFVEVLVGPFNTMGQLLHHIAFIKSTGSSETISIWGLTEDQARDYTSSIGIDVISPGADRLYLMRCGE